MGKSRKKTEASTVAATTVGGAADTPAAEAIVIHPEISGGDVSAETLAGAGADPAPVDHALPRVIVREVGRGDGAAAGAALDDGVAHRQPDGAGSTAPELASARPQRALSLDALRGLFLVAMTVGFTINGDFFPLWMYHRQFPPPDYAMVPVAGIGWRDLTYGAFLFTMAAALPLTLSRLIDRGATEVAIAANAFRRYALLLVYALLIGHANTYFTGYTQTTRALAIAGFAILTLIFTRRRPDWDPRLFAVLRVIGWTAAAAFLAFSPLLYGQRFSFARIDDIIAGLAFAVLAGSLIWYVTRENLTARLGILAAAAALYLSSRADGWISQWWWSSPAPWAFSASRLTLLCIVIPGTIAGDTVLRWSRAHVAAVEDAVGTWSAARLVGLAILAFSFAPLIVAGLYSRHVELTTQVSIGLVLAGLFLTWKPTRPVEHMLRSLFFWGAAWLLIGLFLEPSEGGIKKVPETLSYFFTVAGVTVMLLVALTAIVDGLRASRSVQALIDVGHNPMLAYVLFTMLLNSAFEMVPPLRGVLGGSPGEALLRTGVEVLLVVLLVRAASRRKIYWRT